MFRGQCHLHVMYSFFSISSMPAEASLGCVCIYICGKKKKKRAVNHSVSYVKRLLQACSWPVVRCDVYCNLCCSIKQCVFLLAEHWSIGTVLTLTFFFKRNDKGELLLWYGKCKGSLLYALFIEKILPMRAVFFMQCGFVYSYAV